MPAPKGPNLGLMFGWTEDDSFTDLVLAEFLCRINADLRGLDTLVALAIKDKDLTAPPGSPAEGDRYIVGASPTGAWSGKTKNVAVYFGGAWVFFAPKEGWLAWANDEDVLYVYDGTSWGTLASGGGGGGGGTRYWYVLGTDLWAGNSSIFERSNGSDTAVEEIQYSGFADIAHFASFVVPGDYASLTAIDILFADISGTSTNPVVWRLGLVALADGTDSRNAYTVSDTTVTPNGVQDRLKISTLTAPSVTLTPGDIVKIMVERQASTNGTDTNTDTMAVIGVRFKYST